MILTSPSFADGAMLPFECAYEGSNASPALSWSGAPSGTRSFALSCIDHSSPNPVGWVHWLQWNIPAFETRRRSKAFRAPASTTVTLTTPPRGPS